MSKNQSSRALRITVFSALLAALSIVLGKYLAFNIGQTVRISFENLPVLIAGIFFGPIVGGAVGAVADLIGSIMVGYAINPIITAGAALVGAVSGLVSMLLGKERRITGAILGIICAHTVGSLFVKTLGMWVFYGSPFWVTLAWRALTYLLVGAAECAVICLLSKNKVFIKEIGSI